MRTAGRHGAMLLATMMLALGAASQEQQANDTDISVPDEIPTDFLINLPQCAMTCFLEMRQDDGAGCSTDDIDCLCRSTTIAGQVTRCVMGSCPVKEGLIARRLTSKACNRPIRDEHRTYTIVAIVFSVVSGLAVLQRFVAKILAETLVLGLDDYMVLLAALTQAAMAAVGVEGGVNSGLGRDIWTLEFSQITDFSYWLYIFSVLYFLNIAIVKLAFLFFYLRVFPKRSVRRYLWGTVVFTILFGIAFTVAGIFQCQPVSYYWTRWSGETKGTCVHVSALAWANSAIGITLDLWMIAIPLSQVRELNLDLKKKAEVAFMFCVGLFVTIISCLRLESLVTHDSSSPNATWVKQEVAIWSTVEINVGIICACLPSIRTLAVMALAYFGLLSNRRRRSQNVGHNDQYRNSRHFGTISRSIAEPMELGRTKIKPLDGIRMERTCHVEFEKVADPHSDEARLVEAGDPRWLASTSNESIDKEKESHKHKEFRP